VWAATSPQLTGLGGLYCQDCDVAVLAEHEVAGEMSRGVKPWAIEPGTAERLWVLSEHLTGIRLLT
jgi:hypothetical protein